MNRRSRPRDADSPTRAAAVLAFCRAAPRSLAEIVAHFRAQPANRIRAAVQNLVMRGELVNLNAGTGPGQPASYRAADALPAVPTRARRFTGGAELFKAWRPQASC